MAEMESLILALERNFEQAVASSLQEIKTTRNAITKSKCEKRNA